MSGMPLETCWAVNERWNNTFCYKVASCWLFLLSHTTMHGSMNNNPLNAELNPICHVLALLRAHPILHVSRIRVKDSTCFERCTAHHHELQLYLQPLVYIRVWWPPVVKSEWELRLDYGRSPHTYLNQRLQIQLELLMMSDIPLETCWAFNEQVE